MKRVNGLIQRTALYIALTLLWGPVLVAVLSSFNDGRQALVWRGLSLRWYAELFGNPVFLNSLRTTLTVASLTALSATALGGTLALAINRSGQRPGRYAQVALAIPLVLPDIVVGISSRAWYSFLHLPLGWWTVYLAHTGFAAAFAYFVIAARLNKYNFELESAAADLGARPPRILLTVTLPALAPSIAAATLLCFTLSLDDTVVALFTNGAGSPVLSVVLFSLTRLGVSPLMNALATVLLATTLFGICLLALLYRNLETRNT